MYAVDIRWIVLVVCVVSAGVAVAIEPSLINPVLVAVAVGTLLYLVLRLGKSPGSAGQHCQETRRVGANPERTPHCPPSPCSTGCHRGAGQRACDGTACHSIAQPIHIDTVEVTQAAGGGADPERTVEPPPALAKKVRREVRSLGAASRRPPEGRSGRRDAARTPARARDAG